MTNEAQTTEKQADEIIALKTELAIAKRNYDHLYHEYRQACDELHEYQMGRRLTGKQEILCRLVLSSHGTFPHFFSVGGRWNRAEKLYAEGVRRGHFPKDPAP